MSVRTFQFPVQAPLVGVPSWASSAPLWQWVTIPATSTLLAKMDAANPGGSKPFIYSYSSAALHPDTLDLYVMGGGHADYAGNEVYKLGLNSEAPVWTRLSTPTQAGPDGLYPLGTSLAGAAYYWDGRPTSRHTWRQLTVVPSRNALMTFGAGAVWGNGNGSFANVDAWSLTTNDYVIPSPYPSVPLAEMTKVVGVLDEYENWWYAAGSSVYKWTNATNSWALAGSSVNFTEAVSLYDSLRKRVVRLPENYGNIVDGAHWPSNSAFASTRFSYATPPSGTWLGTAWHDVHSDRYILLQRSQASITQVWSINPGTWVATAQPTTGSPAVGGTDGERSWYNRFHYVHALHGFVLLTQAGSPAYFMRTS